MMLSMSAADDIELKSHTHERPNGTVVKARITVECVDFVHECELINVDMHMLLAMIDTEDHTSRRIITTYLETIHDVTKKEMKNEHAALRARYKKLKHHVTMRMKMSKSDAMKTMATLVKKTKKYRINSELYEVMCDIAPSVWSRTDMHACGMAYQVDVPPMQHAHEVLELGGM